MMSFDTGFNTDYYNSEVKYEVCCRELCSMRFVGYVTSSVANPDPARSGNRTPFLGTAQVVSVCNLQVSESTWNCVCASLKNFFFFFDR